MKSNNNIFLKTVKSCLDVSVLPLLNCLIVNETAGSSNLCESEFMTSLSIDTEFCCYMYRSNRPEVFCKKGVLRNFATFTGKHLCQSLYFNKVAGLKPATLLKKRFWHRCFSVNFVKFLRTLFLYTTSPAAASVRRSCDLDTIL